MAIYGIGAMYGGTRDKSNEFLKQKCACIGWDEKEAPGLHKMLTKIKTGDFIYIKSMDISKKSLGIKAIGVVYDDQIKDYGLGKGVSVKWLWPLEGVSQEKIAITSEMYKNNVFNNTLYEEYNPVVQSFILNKVFGGL
ncbi:hypothetical protein [Bacillus kexueae]|uniref:hypothetical protein n=1 Tax=Aeribacillus kexueae TaxID=2078952 RepID=UPI001FAE89C4|nr:hypothetical protein [Bacillus kexueae]